jgi:hypothetical protein
MNKLVAALSFALISLNVLAQQSVSKADALENKPNTVVQKEYLKITTFKNVAIVVEYITDLTSNQKLSALDLEFSTSGENAETVSTMLDPDEVDGLLAFLQNIQDNITKAAAPKNYTEYTYLTKSGMEAGCYFDKTWKTYIRIDKDDSKTNVELEKDDLVGFVSFVRQAKSKF